MIRHGGEFLTKGHGGRRIAPASRESFGKKLRNRWLPRRASARKSIEPDPVNTGGGMDGRGLRPPFRARILPLPDIMGICA